MYNTKNLEAFIEKINKEADKAAQAVYDKHLPELIRRIQAQMHKDDVMTIGMGSASIDREDKEFVGEELANIAARTQYCEDLEANFTLPYKITKTTTSDD